MQRLLAIRRLTIPPSASPEECHEAIAGLTTLCVQDLTKDHGENLIVEAVTVVPFTLQGENRLHVQVLARRDKSEASIPWYVASN